MKMHFEVRRRRSIRAASTILIIAVALASIGRSALGQAGDNAAAKQDGAASRVDTRPFQTFYLTNATQANDANEIVVAVRNILSPDVKILLVPSQNAIVVRASADQLAQAQKIINDLDRAKSTYRLTYTFTEIDGGKRVGTQHYSMIVIAGQRTVMKQGNKVPIATGSFSEKGSSEAQTQFTYLDVGMNFDATLDPYANGARLRTKVEQLGVAEQVSGVGLQDPIIRQSQLEGTAFLTPGKPVILGSMDVPGSTRHLDIEVVMEALK
jgi:type II secretory pathway component GspD/PulD (secretin)